MAIIQNERQQSALNMACLTWVRSVRMGLSCCCGNCDKACSSLLDTNEPKNTLGIRANSKAMPAVSPKLMYTYFILCVSRSGSSIIFFKAIIASSGMVNSAMTRIEATVRNLAYSGM